MSLAKVVADDALFVVECSFEDVLDDVAEAFVAASPLDEVPEEPSPPGFSEAFEFEFEGVVL